ncbi:MAG: hypothetical protein EXS09_14935 [Gemmataceae bacterium]|nr:hypothetical protein [Gemmataceae bacterium]
MHRRLIVLALLIVASFAHADTKPDLLRKTTPSLPLPVPLSEMSAATRDTISPVMKDATIRAICPPEEFIAHADMYKWLLDHPDRTAAAWRKLGVEAIQIKPMKDGGFSWKDNGSELVWQAVAQSATGRIWFAEGHVKPGFLLPTCPVKAVAVLNHSEKQRQDGDVSITHQIEIYLKTDSKAASLAAKILGDSATKMAEQGSEQLLMFFSGIAKYAHDKPEKLREVLSDKSR